MSDRTLSLSISTPEAVIVARADIRSLRAADASGDFGILPGHADLLTVLPASVVRFRAGDDVWQFCAVRGGVMTVSGGDRVAIACRQASLSDDLDALAAAIAADRAAGTDADRRARVDEMRLHARAVRQMLRYLRPDGRGAAAPFSSDREAPRPAHGPPTVWKGPPAPPPGANATAARCRNRPSAAGSARSAFSAGPSSCRCSSAPSSAGSWISGSAPASSSPPPSSCWARPSGCGRPGAGCTAHGGSRPMIDLAALLADARALPPAAGGAFGAVVGALPRLVRFSTPRPDTKLYAGGSPAKAFLLQMLRFAVLVGVFYGLARLGALPLLSAAVALVAVRLVVVRRFRRRT